ncbi:MAG: hypothetical protein K2O49_08365 [Muribaculaceae bacterium]|nr:hypothetical protein [Muribaculaceae bacterium]
MIRLLLISLFSLLLGVFSVSADGKKGKTREQVFKEIQEFKMNYLAKEMDLKEDQRQKFFDLYEEMTRKRKECMKNARHLERRLKKLENPTEADYQAATEAMTKARAEDASIEKTYSEKFSTFLTQKQIFKMKEGEEAFRKKMEEMRRKHHKEKKEKK